MPYVFLSSEGHFGKLVQIGNIVIRVYTNNHLPPHFHISTPNGDALADIETLEILDGKPHAMRKTPPSNGQQRTRQLLPPSGTGPIPAFQSLEEGKQKWICRELKA